MSAYKRACDNAREASAKLGHELARAWEVRDSMAHARCTRCNAPIVVRFYDALDAFGPAVELPCKEGNVNAVEPAPTVPPTDGVSVQPELTSEPAAPARKLRNNNPPPPADSVPWFMRDKVKVAAGRSNG